MQNRNDRQRDRKDDVYESITCIIKAHCSVRKVTQRSRHRSRHISRRNKKRKKEREREMDTNVRTGVKNWCELLPFFGEFRSHSD
jgi:hypothetical protein